MFCSVIARNYLAHARVLTRSLREHHPGARVAVLIVDETQSSLYNEEFEVLIPHDIGIERETMHEMAAMYGVMELCTAVKPALFLHLLETVEEPVVFLDPDVLVLSPLNGVDDLAREHGLVLTPQCLDPSQFRARSILGVWPDDRLLLRYGQFNGGFLAVTREATPFLRWWSEWLRFHCLNEDEEFLSLGFFVDQKWLDCVPNFFPHVVLRDPGFNVANWNLQQRPVSRRDGGYVCADVPLRFFHFSGFDPTRSEVLVYRYASAETVDVVKDLCVEYATRLFEHNYAEVSAIPFAFATSASGLPMDTRMRRLYREALLANRVDGATLPDPFDRDEAAQFTDWLGTPSEVSHGLPRYLFAQYSTRPELRARFPDLTEGQGRRAFLQWVHEFGDIERIPREFVPSLEDIADVDVADTVEAEKQALCDQVRALRVELETLRSSKTFRYTSPLRAVWARVRRVRSSRAD